MDGVVRVPHLRRHGARGWGAAAQVRRQQPNERVEVEALDAVVHPAVLGPWGGPGGARICVQAARACS